MFMVFILTGKTAFLILRKRACLLYAAVPAGEPLEAHESWSASCAEPASCFAVVFRLRLAVSCPAWVAVARQQGFVLAGCHEQVTSSSDLSLSFLDLVLFRLSRRAENGKNAGKNNEGDSKVLLSVKCWGCWRAYGQHTVHCSVLWVLLALLRMHKSQSRKNQAGLTQLSMLNL